MNVKERIIECFEAIAHGRLQIIGDGEPGAVDLTAAQVLIEPRIRSLWQQVAKVEHGIDGSLLDNLRAAESATGYLVGVLCGIDLCARPEIVSRFAELYARETKPAVDRLFESDLVVLSSIRGGRA